MPDNHQISAEIADAFVAYEIALSEKQRQDQQAAEEFATELGAISEIESHKATLDGLKEYDNFARASDEAEAIEAVEAAMQPIDPSTRPVQLTNQKITELLQ